MKRSTIEVRLNAAMERHRSAQSEADYLTQQIDHHDREASRIRKKRQLQRSKAERAVNSIANLHALLAKS